MIVLKRRTTGLMLAAGLLAGIGVAQAKTVELSARLHPFPNVQTKGSGSMHGTYDTVTHRVTWTVTFKDLTSPAIMAHFHGPISAPGQNAPVQVWLTAKPPHPLPDAPIKGSAVLTPVQGEELMGGHLYIVIHTKDHPAGEVRGDVHASM